MKKQLTLDHGWKLWSTPHGKNPASETAPAGAGLLDVDLPEDVHAALCRSGKIPDYHMGDNFIRCQWVNDLDWYFQKAFILPPDWPKTGTALICQGIDLFGEVWMNGKRLGRTENAFLPARFEVTRFLKPKAANLLTVRIESLARRLGRKTYTATADDWRTMRTLVRKPQFSFGWDWGPCLPATGLDRVRLVTHGKYEIADVYIRPRLSGRADFFIEMNAQIERDGGELEVTVEGHGFSQTKRLRPAWPRKAAKGPVAASASRNARIQAARFCTSFRVKNPRLWWPSGYGEQPLYHYQVRFLQNGDELDRRQGRFGFRKVRTYEKPFEPNGLTWGLEINGRKMLIRGANWIPSQIFPYLQKEEDYRAPLRRTVEAHFNMLRVWGGGAYEREAFYDFCDQHGIMVWQDFMFASAAYGVHNKAFRASVVREAEYQVRRLRNRPCVVLWCGCNEDSQSWTYHGDVLDDGYASLWAESGRNPVPLREQEKELYSMILRGTVSRLTELPYVESSPQSHGDYGNDPLSGNSHHSCHKYSIQRSAQNFRDHFRIPTSFNSEFCVQGPARKRTLERFLPGENRWPPDQVWTTHIMRGHYGIAHHELQERFATELFGPVETLEQFCRYGMAFHAEFMRAEFESVRHWRGKSGGAMAWMLNDCWPTSNWSIVDYYNVPKAAFYAAKRACAPTVLVLFPSGRGKSIVLTLCNQSGQKLSGTVRWGETRVSGEPLDQQARQISVAPYRSKRIAAIRPSTENGTFVWADGDFTDLHIERITYFPNLWKDVDWPEPEISFDIADTRQEGEKFLTRVIVRAKRYARFVHLDAEPLGQTTFSDSFFDLAGGDEKVVEILSPKKIAESDIHVRHWLTKWS